MTMAIPDSSNAAAVTVRGRTWSPRRASAAIVVLCGDCHICGLVAKAWTLWVGTRWPGVDPRRPMDA